MSDDRLAELIAAAAVGSSTTLRDMTSALRELATLRAALADLTSDEWWLERAAELWRKNSSLSGPKTCAEIVRERLKDSRERPASSS